MELVDKGGAKFVGTAPEFSVDFKIGWTCPCDFHFPETSPKLIPSQLFLDVRLGIMAHELQPVMPTAVPGRWLWMACKIQFAIEVDWLIWNCASWCIWIFGLCQNVERLCWPQVAQGKLWRLPNSLYAMRSVCFQREDGPIPRVSQTRRKMSVASEFAKSFFPTNICRRWHAQGHAGSRYTPALCGLGVCAFFAVSRSQNGSENYQNQNASYANSMLECSETNHQQNGCFLSLAGMNSRRWFDDFDAIPKQMDCKQVNNKTMRFSMHKIFQIISQYMEISQVMGVSP